MNMKTDITANLFALGAFSLTGMVLSSCQQQIKTVGKPNVIIIYADDLGFGDVSANGSTTISTPNFDRIASEGIRFTNSHTTSSTSTPARYGLLTGCYPWRKPGTGIATGDAGMIIRPEQYTMADMFKSEGYATGAVGKWHLGLGDRTGTQDWNGTISPALVDIGFEYSYIMAATGDRVPCVWIENGRVVNLDPEDPISVSYKTPFPGEPTGRSNPELLRIHPSGGHDEAIINGIPRIGYMKGGNSALWVDEEISDMIAEKAVDFISAHKDSPFFLYVGTHDIHVPRVPNERFVGKSGMGPRGDAILSFDYTIGVIADALDSLGIADNTLLVISSDNGPVIDDGYQDMAMELLGDHSPAGEYRGYKYTVYEGGTRVPMVLRWRGHVKPATVQPALVSHIDFMASLGALIGAEIPQGAAMDSRNNIDVLVGKSHRDREYVVEQNMYNTLALIEGEWKYVEVGKSRKTHSKGTNIEYGNYPYPQLFRINSDVSETTNVAEQYPEVVDTLKSHLDRIKSTPLLPGESSATEYGPGSYRLTL